MSTTAPAVTVRGLAKRYGGRAVVDGVDLDVARGEVVGIIGPNGSGKTTTVECLQGLRRPDAGTVRVLGLDPATQRGALRARIGAQLQDSALPDRIRVEEALDLFSRLARRRRDWRPLLTDWGLEPVRRTAFASLSGGQRQRLFVALALAGDPELVFLDEMTTGLDPAARRTAWELIGAVRDRGTTVVLVTHVMEEAERLCDRVAVMRAGRIVAAGTPGELAARAGAAAVTFTTRLADVGFLRDVPGVTAVGRRGARVRVTGEGPVLARCAAALVARGDEPLDLAVRMPSLEDAFLAFTGEGR